MLAGIILLIIGVLLLLDNSGLLPRGDFWDYFWPVIIIAVGIHLLLKNVMSKPKQ